MTQLTHIALITSLAFAAVGCTVSPVELGSDAETAATCENTLDEVPRDLRIDFPEAGDIVAAVEGSVLNFESGATIDTGLSAENLLAAVGAEVVGSAPGITLAIDGETVAIISASPLADAIIEATGAETDLSCSSMAAHHYWDCGDILLDRYALVLGDSRVEPGAVGIIGSGAERWEVNNLFVGSRVWSSELPDQCADLWPMHGTSFAVRVAD